MKTLQQIREATEAQKSKKLFRNIDDIDIFDKKYHKKIHDAVQKEATYVTKDDRDEYWEAHTASSSTIIELACSEGIKISKEAASNLSDGDLKTYESLMKKAKNHYPSCVKIADMLISKLDLPSD